MENLLVIAGAFVTAVILGRIIIPNILLVSFRKRLFDAPDPRKIHHNLVPRLGGVSFFPVVLFCVCLFISLRLLYGADTGILFPGHTTTELLLFASGLTLLYIVGVADDLVGVRYRKKFLVQLLSALMLPFRALHQQLLRVVRDLCRQSPFRHPPDPPPGCLHHERHQPDRRNRRPGLRPEHGRACRVRCIVRVCRPLGLRPGLLRYHRRAHPLFLLQRVRQGGARA